ncbi:hypothetical protein E1292_35710 [Nonomuraea deserti]|uniref:Uncharacterized protein n=1 Tax=Nonomuraea deserti TaxID=1848322 RepID=A0A4R4VEW3_9ACTN|nr:hypothetical protein [Nonomuraea deserti]TDC98189.1 hypothetical protein E1292_35710 [Nonomuraea deserti]
MDSTHPPTYLRMEWVAALPYGEGRMAAGEATRGADGGELDAAAGRVAQAIRENAQSALYR